MDSGEFAEIDFEFRKASNSLDRSYPKPRGNYCSADQINGFVVDSDGSLYKCLSDIGYPERKIGTLDSE